ncbi:Protein of unknown function [Gryllus bimaculatus]|nr:Protein of unknown function [Gryllus bimaculatus]
MVTRETCGRPAWLAGRLGDRSPGSAARAEKRRPPPEATQAGGEPEVGARVGWPMADAASQRLRSRGPP